MPSLRNKNVRGDHYVTLVVQVPEKLSEQEKEILRKYDESSGGGATEEGAQEKKKGFFKKDK
mgnify:FL=1